MCVSGVSGHCGKCKAAYVLKRFVLVSEVFLFVDVCLAENKPFGDCRQCASFFVSVSYNSIFCSGKTSKLDNVTFHQYVNLTRFKSEKTVSFVPPDGDFELMKYCFTEGVSLPFQILPTIKELGQTLMQVNVKVKSVFGVKMFALVVIRIPVPKQTVKQVSKSHLVEQSIMLPIDSLLWKIRKFPGQTKPTLSAEVELISIMAEKRSWMRPPIQMEFEVPK
ncbi:hypothetical protein Goklo_014439 [Gossypium klotzschianum]|uniref:MHD domain-containing protein n=1 Tax=Gossypium klotzschianum TaxID=34286 RepID=A0A7J8U7R3_9ROSI|nr:hypothetical protein [Gossypium klotzschianum]